MKKMEKEALLTAQYAPLAMGQAQPSVNMTNGHYRERYWIPLLRIGWNEPGKGFRLG